MNDSGGISVFGKRKNELKNSDTPKFAFAEDKREEIYTNLFFPVCAEGFNRNGKAAAFTVFEGKTLSNIRNLKLCIKYGEYTEEKELYRLHEGVIFLPAAISVFYINNGDTVEYGVKTDSAVKITDVKFGIYGVYLV